MKQLIALLLVVAINQDALAQPDPDNRLVVYGEGVIDAPANQARMTFTVVGFGPSMLDAMASAKAKLAAISKRLFSAGLTEKNLLTGNFYSGDNSQDKAFLSSSRDFRTQMDVLITMDTLTWVDSVISILASSNAERLSSIIFSLKSDSLVRAQVRQRAVSNAKEKAGIMASQLGIQLGKVVYLEELFGLPRSSISTEQSYFRPRNTTNTIRVDNRTIAYFGGQRFVVSSYVKVVYEIK